MVVYWIEAITRWVVLGAFLLTCLVLATHWAVRQGRLKAFGVWPRFVRRVSDPLLRPIERRMTRFGANPQDAPIWLAGTVLVGGLLVLAAVHWLISAVFYVGYLAHGGPRAWLGLGINLLYWIFAIALLLRVIGSWISWPSLAPVMRLAHRLTDWLVLPIRRVLPPTGVLDFSPLVAWFVLILLRQALFWLLRA